MKRRAFRPGTDADPDRIATGHEPRYREPGSTFEPAHRQRVDVHFEGGVTADAVYNRDTSSFWVNTGDGYVDSAGQAVEWWCQKAPTRANG